MKIKLKLLLLSIVFLIASCDKEDRMENKLQGRWELRHQTGIQILGVPPDFPPGNGNIIKFDKDKYEVYNNGKLISSNAITIEREKKEIDDVKFSYKFIHDGDRSNFGRYFKVSGNTLLISYGSIASDGSTFTYKKL